MPNTHYWKVLEMSIIITILTTKMRTTSGYRLFSLVGVTLSSVMSIIIIRPRKGLTNSVYVTFELDLIY